MIIKKVFAIATIAPLLLLSYPTYADHPAQPLPTDPGWQQHFQTKCISSYYTCPSSDCGKIASGTGKLDYSGKLTVSADVPKVGKVSFEIKGSANFTVDWEIDSNFAADNADKAYDTGYSEGGSCWTHGIGCGHWVAYLGDCTSMTHTVGDWGWLSTCDGTKPY